MALFDVDQWLFCSNLPVVFTPGTFAFMNGERAGGALENIHKYIVLDIED